jgi:hypothetical protein
VDKVSCYNVKQMKKLKLDTKQWLKINTILQIK